ncbi:MAG: lamin tail domain-containing protein, partial [Bacteroidia bacterium]|nr:lamin tail domain-containing protein [Bacteroidia bacterium]
MKHKITLSKSLLAMLCAMLLSAASFGQLRISQVYGAGGNSGATYNRDFVEIFNPTASPITVTNYAVQYASATGSSWQVQAFSATINPGKYFLIALGSGANGSALPTPDVSGGIAMAATAGKLALTSTNTALTGVCPTGGTIVDFVGFGTTANCFEGAGPTPAPSTINSVFRAAGGCTDANSNNTDFSAAAVSPRNSASAASPCFTPPTVTTDPATVTSSTDATLNGTVNANGSSTATSFEYGLTVSYGSTATATPTPVTGTSPTAISAAISGLSVNTQYNFRAVGTGAGITNGSNATFYTFANVPSAPTVGNPSSATLDVSITGTDGNPSSTEYAIQETGSGNYVQANGSLGATDVWNSASVWGSKTVTGLTASTLYTFQVKARNGDLVETGFGLTTSGTTSGAGSPLITVTASLTSFSSVAGSPSASQSYFVEGNFLVDDITITPPANFEISLDNSTWVNSSSFITLTQSSGSVASTQIYVQLNAASAGIYSGSISHVSNTASTQNLPVNGTALSAEPTLASSVTFGATGSTTMTINFSGGDGSSRIVVMSAVTAVGFVPSDGNAVSGVNTDFSVAADQGSGNKIVYDGTGNTVNVTGLSSGTIYHVAVYEYNGTTATANYFLTPGTGSNSTTVPEPTVASTLTFGAVGSTTMVLNFTGGNGASRIVVAKELAAVSFTPTDLTGYTGVDSDFSLAADQSSGNKIVYDGSGNSVTVTGLTQGNTYFFVVYEYNGAGANANYLLTPNGANSTATVGPVPYPITGSTYNQDFNGLPATGSFTLVGSAPYYLSTSPVNASGMPGWQFGVTLSTPRFGVSSGSGSPTGSTYSTGASGDPERSLGMFASGSNVSNIGLILRNTTTDILSTVTISFTGEQWRRGGGAANVLTFKYAVGGTDINTGSFVTEPALNFVSPVTTGANIGLDGNVAPNRTFVSATFDLGTNWAPGQTLVLRWDDADDPNTDDMLSIEDLSFVAVGPTTPIAQDSTITFPTILTTSVMASWLNGDGVNRIVKVNTTNSFTDPVDGNTYTANSVYAGGEQVVYDGTGNSVTVSNLSASTQYYFRVYSYNGTGAGTKYNVSTATDNPNSVTTAAPSFPTQLVVLDVNGGVDVMVNQPFTVTVQSQDNFGSPQDVSQNTTVDLSVFTGFGSLFSGNTTGVILANTNQITITGVIYDIAESGVSLNAATIAGDILTDGQSQTFSVYDVANQLAFMNVPLNGVVGIAVSSFEVHAVRPDLTTDPGYAGSATIAIFNGPGALSGTLTVPFVNGVATFSNISFSQVGTYILEATSGSLVSAFSNSILINPPVSFTELVVPQFIGSKTTTGASGTNTNRTPIAVCFQIDYLTPNTSYNVAAGIGLTSDASTVLGAGTIWNGTAYLGQTRNTAFTTDANGSSGPVWIYLQPSGNETRFGAGAVHNVRIAYSTGSFGTNIAPNFITTKTITALDVASTALTTSTLDDGAFLTGSLAACVGGKYILIYDNTAGTGDPIFSYPSNPNGLTQATQSGFPGTLLDQIFMGTAAPGTFAAVYQIGANNSNGIRRVEARNSDNSIAAFETSATGIWADGTNTTTATRRQVVSLTNADVSLTSVTISATGTNILCFGESTGTATAVASSSNAPIDYLWSPGNEITNSISNLSAGIYTVTATDGIGCTASSSVTVTQPNEIIIVGQVTNTGCTGSTGSIDITVAGGTPPNTFAWSNSETTEDISGLAAGTYTVTITDASGCTKSESFTIITQSSSTISVTATPTEICDGGSSVLEATGASTYTWSPSGSLSSSTGSIVTATPSVTTTYTVTAVDISGCTTLGSVTLTVNNLPSVAVTPVSSTICEGSSVNLTATGASTYSWSPATGLDVTSGSTVVASPIATTTYTVTGTTVEGCTATATATVDVTNTSSPTVTSPVTYCQNDVAAPLTATTLPGYSAWWYTTPTGGNANTSITPSTATAGSTTYYVAQQPTVPLSIAITGFQDNTSPDPYTFVALSRIPAGTVIYFTDNGWTGTGFRGSLATDANGSEGFVRWTAVNTVAAGTTMLSGVNSADYIWTTSGPITCSACTSAQNYTPLDFAGGGDQIYAFTSTVTDNPLFNTAQQIHLAVFDDTNNFENATSTATGSVPPGLTATVEANTFAFASANYVNLNNDAQTRTINDWRTYIATSTNYTTGTGANPGLPSTPLNVDLGCESPRTPITVIVNEAPVVTATADPILCNGGTTVVTVSATGGVTPYTGTGTFTVSAGMHSYTVAGADGCSGTASITLTEPTAIVVTAVETTPVLCNGGTATVTVTATGGTGILTGEGTFTVSAGTHNYTVTDANGCTGSTSITITEPSAIVVTVVETTPIACPGGTATVTVSASGGTGTLTGTGPFTVTAGTHNYTVTDANGCTGLGSITIVDPPAVNVSNFTPTSGCVGSTVSIFGSNLNLVTAIDLNGISTIFVIVNSGEITVTIPPA